MFNTLKKYICSCLKLFYLLKTRKMKKSIAPVLAAVMLLLAVNLFSQGVGIGPSTFTLNPAAGLQVNFPDKGILFPQVDMQNNLTVLPANSEGLVVYNTADFWGHGPGLYVNTSFTSTPLWQEISTLYGYGTPSQLTYWSGISSLASCWNFYYDNVQGRLGLGTTTPNEQLEISGNFRLPNSTSAAGNIMKGGLTFIHNYGTDNTFIGEQAGNLTMTGGYNAGFGKQSLVSNTSGTENTAIGFDALSGNYGGSLNTAIGTSTLVNNVSGNRNTVLGTYADLNGDNLSNCIAIGYNVMAERSNEIRLGNNGNNAFYCEAVKNTTTANPSNVYIDPGTGSMMMSTGSFTGNGLNGKVTFWNGTNSLSYNSNFHWDNTNSRLGIGTSAPLDQLELTGNLRLTSSGVVNKGTSRFLHSSGGTFLGTNAGTLSATSTGNCGIGSYSLSALTSGYDNTAVGTNALNLNATANENVAIGGFALFKLASGSGDNNTNNVAVGNFAGFNINPNSSSNGRHNVSVGHNSMYNTTTGSYNTALGYQALDAYSSDQNIAIGALSDINSASVTNSIAIGFNTITSASNEIRLGNNAYTTLFCQAVKNNTSANPANVYVDPSTGQILQAAAAFTGSGAANKISFWTGSYGLGYNNLLQWDNTTRKMSIGSDTPDTNARLYVSSNSRYAGFFTTDKNDWNTKVIQAVYSGTNYDAIAVYGKSVTPGSGIGGIGGSFEGGYKGVSGIVTNTAGGSHIGGEFKVETEQPGVNGFHYGVKAYANKGGYNYGIYSEAYNGDYNYGIYSEAAGGIAFNYAGYFSGDVSVTGYLYKGGGTFMIDHPLDPENKYLLHSFVESPDMKNMYDGVAVLDENGNAVVELPGYFEALNKDFRYQLTAIGAPGPNLYVAQKVNNNHFSISGGQPGMEVSWQVTGIRKDALAEHRRIQVEVDKPAEDRGKYLYPEAYGKPKEMGIDYSRSRKMRERGKSGNGTL
jgi:hypothetical protein